MKISKLYKLKIATERASSLQRDWERQKRKLLALPARLGFSSLRELQAALALVGARTASRSSRKQVQGRKKRVQITPELEARVKTLVQGGKTNEEMANILSLSPSSIQNIKARLELTKKRRR